MRLHRHYKGKAYRLIGTVKHSETLEDLTLYECLYDNPLGRQWVRPKAMFEGDLEVGGVRRRRFQPARLDIQSATAVSPAHLEIIAQVARESLGEWKPEPFQQRLKSQSRVHVAVALVDDEPAGFKIGYEESAGTFYSWLGGVRPKFQGAGVAKALMDEQHRWCRAQGYRTLHTKTLNRFQAMLIFNIKSGFEITGTEPSDVGTKILMRKFLSAEALR